EQIGLVLAWAGLPQLLVIPFVPFLLKRFDARVLVCVGLVIFAVSCFMNTHLSFNDGGEQLTSTNVIRAFGQAIVLSPLASIAMANIGQGDSAAASGLFNMLRSLGGAIGTAALATVITKREQFHSNIVGQSVTGASPADQAFLTKMEHYFWAHGVSDPARAHHEAEILLGKFVAQQASIMAFSDAFFVMAVVLVVAAAFVAATKAPGGLRPSRV
ncbi:MAG: EmrB/QacA family drug resistance transporter, partial [Microvirga sp.]